MNPYTVEVVLHWTAVGIYVVATVAFAHAVIFGHPERAKYGLAAAAAGLLPHGAAIVVRWAATGHGPYMLKHEVLSSNAWIAIAMLLGFLLRRRAWSAVALVVLPATIIMLGAGLFSNPKAQELPPTLRSVWLVFHVSFAKLAAGSFLLSLAAAVLQLLKREPPRAGSWLERVPDPGALEAYVVRFIGFGFLFWTMAVAAGSIWANQSWGRYWGWDVVETWSLITWLVYGTFLHVRLFFKPRPTVVASLSIAAFAVFVLTIFILPYLMPSLHAAYFQ